MSEEFKPTRAPLRHPIEEAIVSTAETVGAVADAIHAGSAAIADSINDLADAIRELDRRV